MSKKVKSFTSLEQSKKLAEILPVESADMIYLYWINRTKQEGIDTIPTIRKGLPIDSCDIPCWSLAALLAIVPDEIEIGGQRYAPCLFPVNNGRWIYKLWYNSNNIFTSPIDVFEDNPIDACYEMILKLNGLNLL